MTGVQPRVGGSSVRLHSRMAPVVACDCPRYHSRVVSDPSAVEQGETRDRAKAANLAHAALSLQPKRWNGLTILVLSFIGFTLASARDTSLRDLGLLVAVLLLHEGGHLVGMRLFGFSDLRMFFLPFFGAAASGRKPGANAVEHAIVALLGPVPGLLVALPLAFVADSGISPDGPLPMLVLFLVLINGFNLLPILPLDGGRLFEALIFERHPALDVLFRLLAIAGLGWLAFNGFPALGVLAVLMLIRLRLQAAQAFEAARLRRAFRYSSEIAANGDEELAALHDAAVRAVAHLRVNESTRKGVWQQAVRDIFDRVAHSPANWWQTLLLLLVWLLALVVGAVALLVLFSPAPGHR